MQEPSTDVKVKLNKLTGEAVINFFQKVYTGT